MTTTVEIEILNPHATGDDQYLYPFFTDNVMSFEDIPNWDRQNFTDGQNEYIATWLNENMTKVCELLNEQYEKDNMYS
jgi:hypothetical protein